MRSLQLFVTKIILHSRCSAYVGALTKAGLASILPHYCLQQTRHQQWHHTWKAHGVLPAATLSTAQCMVFCIDTHYHPFLLQTGHMFPMCCARYLPPIPTPIHRSTKYSVASVYSAHFSLSTVNLSQTTLHSYPVPRTRLLALEYVIVDIYTPDISIT